MVVSVCMCVAGRSLADFKATLESYGIRSGSRVMVLKTRVGFVMHSLFVRYQLVL